MSLVPRSKPTSHGQDRPLDDEPGAAVGTVTCGFELLSYLGRGGMADVYVARDKKTGMSVALKRMLPWLVKRRSFVELFFHEAQVYASLSHPNVVRGIDVGLDAGVPFLVLELVDGFPCDVLLRSAGAFPMGVAVAIAHEVLMGLAHVHDARDRSGRALGIVHNDIAPDNVVMSRSGRVKLLDFGVAHSLLSRGLMNEAEFRGKIGYVSPESLAGIPTDSRTDLFSVGVLLAEMLIGKPLFGSSSKFQVAVTNFNVDQSALDGIYLQVPDPLRGVLYKALARDRDRRFPDARAFDQALESASNHVARGVDVHGIRSWLGRIGFRAAPSGTHNVGPILRSSEVDAKIDVINGAIDERSPTSPMADSVGRRTPTLSRNGVQRYRIRTGARASQTLTHAEIVAAIVTRQLDGTTQIALGSEPWSSLNETPGFSALLDLPAYRPNPGSYEWQVPLERRQLPRILFEIAAAGDCGMLEARCGTRWKRIFFDGGVAVFAASNDETELLGNYVRTMGGVSAPQLDELVSVAFREGRRLGDVLVAADLMNPAEMLRLLVHQLEARVLDLGAWTAGELGFTRGVRPGLSAPKPLGNPAQLPCRLVRSSYCDEEVAAFLSPLDEAPISISVPATNLDGELTPAEALVLGVLTSPRSLESLLDALGTNGATRSEPVLRTVFLGLSAGVLECQRWTKVDRPSLRQMT
jgi:eukaryotic-like serine/threonine-protein kinase